MTNVVSERRIKCIEWNFQVPGEYFSEVISDRFSLLKDHMCDFEFGYSTAGVAQIRFQSHEELHSPITITVSVASSTCTYPPETRTIETESGLIWNRTIHYLLNCLLTVKAFIDIDPSKDDKSMQTPSYMDPQYLLEGVSRDYFKLLDRGPNHDVEFLCEDGKIPAHKTVLCCRSKVFESMLQSDMVEGKTGQINIQDMDFASCQELLRCLYTGTLPELTVDTAMQFYKTGDKYAVDTLKKPCAEFLLDNLSLENACEILIMADQHNDPDFKKDIIEYFLKEKIPIVGEKWTDFCNENKDLALEVLNLFCQHLSSK